MGRISLYILKLQHTFSQVCSSTTYRFTMHCLVVNKICELQTYLASSSYTGMVFGPSWHDKLCFTLLSMPDSGRGLRSLLVKLLSFSLGNVVLIQLISLQLGCFAATFTHAFTLTLATTQSDVLFVVHAGDSAFITARIGSCTMFLFPPQ